MTPITDEEAHAVAQDVHSVRAIVRDIEDVLLRHGLTTETRDLQVTLAALNLVYDGRARHGDENLLQGSNLLAGTVHHASRVLLDGRDIGEPSPLITVPAVTRL